MDGGVAYYVISYDVGDDTRRNRVHKLLKAYAVPVQYSVFEAELTEEALIQLRYRLLGLLKGEDSVILYPLCGRCHGAVMRIGNTVDPFATGVRILTALRPDGAEL